jgi:hypothetical protein
MIGFHSDEGWSVGAAGTTDLAFAFVVFFAVIFALFHTPQTIFHAFTQQNRMSSPKLTKIPVTQFSSTR